MSRSATTRRSCITSPRLALLPSCRWRLNMTSNLFSITSYAKRSRSIADKVEWKCRSRTTPNRAIGRAGSVGLNVAILLYASARQFNRPLRGISAQGERALSSGIQQAEWRSASRRHVALGPRVTAGRLGRRALLRPRGSSGDSVHHARALRFRRRQKHGYRHEFQIHQRKADTLTRLYRENEITSKAPGKPGALVCTRANPPCRHRVCSPTLRRTDHVGSPIGQL